MATTKDAEGKAQDDTGDTIREPVIIDLGRHRRKRIKRLRRGRGRLMEDVFDAMEDLRKAGRIDEDAQPVIAIVRQKRKRRRFRFPF